MKTKRFTLAALLLLSGVAYAQGEFRPKAWPVPYGRITSNVGWRNDPFKKVPKWHNGTDIAVPLGTPVNAVGAGVVYFSGMHSGGYGKLVVIQHADGWLSMYGHNSRLLVKAGQAVDERTIIALAGSTGRSTGVHVHLEFRRWSQQQPRIDQYRHEDPVPQEMPQSASRERHQERRTEVAITTTGQDQDWVSQQWNTDKW